MRVCVCTVAVRTGKLDSGYAPSIEYGFKKLFLLLGGDTSESRGALQVYLPMVTVLWLR